MKYFTFILFIFFISVFPGKGESVSRIDSLKSRLDSTEYDTNQVLLLNMIQREVQKKNPQEALLYSQKELKLAEHLEWTKGEAIANGAVGLAFKNLSDYPSALTYLLKSFKLSQEINFKQGMLYSLGNIGNIYTELADYPKALEYQLKALTIGEQLGNKRNLAGSYINIGNIYEQLSDHHKSLDYYLKGYEFAKEAGDKIFAANALANLGDVYENIHDDAKALDYMIKALKSEEQIDDESGEAITLTDIGLVYSDMADVHKALEYHFKSLALNEKLGNKREIADADENIGAAYDKLQDYNKASEYLLKAKEIGSKVGALDKVRDADELLSDIYEKENKPLLSLEEYKQFITLRDSIKNDNKSKELMRQAMQFEYEKKAAADSIENAEAQKIKDAQISAQEARIKQQNILKIALIGGLVLVLLFAGFIFTRFRIARAQKRIIEDQKIIVEEKNKAILDSIAYAKSLQEAILPPASFVKYHFPESFILYKPKDIVAGDFYWMGLSGETIFIAAADCTGHGVPGAMVSVVCSNALNRTIKEFGITDTGKILDKVRELVVETFEKSEREVKDGMDISLLSINTTSGEIHWSGANNPLWYIRNAAIKEIKADKQPIGKTDNARIFTTNTVDIKRGDTVYLFTDGYADQFGGPKLKKFKYKQLEEKLFEIRNNSMREQKEILNTVFEDWRGTLDQVDDVLIIGIKL